MLIPRPLSTFRSGALVVSTLLLAACAPADSGTNAALPPPSAAFDWVVGKIAGRTVQALKPYDDIGARYVDELEKLADFVDRFDELAAAQSAQPATGCDGPRGSRGRANG